jgi:hypothetical protein
VTTQSLIPVEAPLQPVKIEPVSALAVRVMTVPKSKISEQSPVHAIPAGLLVTAPLLFPSVAAYSRCWSRVNVAVTFWDAVMVTTQSPVPVQAPLQLMKTELARRSRKLALLNRVIPFAAGELLKPQRLGRVYIGCLAGRKVRRQH